MKTFLFIFLIALSISSHSQTLTRQQVTQSINKVDSLLSTCSCVQKENSIGYDIIESELPLVECKDNSDPTIVIVYQVKLRNGHQIRDGEYLQISQNRIVTRALYENDSLRRLTLYTDSSSSGYGIRNNNLHGLFGEYYQNDGLNNLKTQGLYYQDCKTDEWLSFYPNGRLKSRGKYLGQFIMVTHIKKEDAVLFYDQNNKLPYKLPFKQGTEKLRADYGVYTLTLPLQIDLKEGKWEYFGKDGMLIQNVFYSNGKVVTTNFNKQ